MSRLAQAPAPHRPRSLRWVGRSGERAGLGASTRELLVAVTSRTDTTAHRSQDSSISNSLADAVVIDFFWREN